MYGMRNEESVEPSGVHALKNPKSFEGC